MYLCNERNLRPGIEAPTAREMSRDNLLPAAHNSAEKPTRACNTATALLCFSSCAFPCLLASRRAAWRDNMLIARKRGYSRQRPKHKYCIVIRLLLSRGGKPASANIAGACRAPGRAVCLASSIIIAYHGAHGAAIPRSRASAAGGEIVDGLVVKYRLSHEITASRRHRNRR